MDIINFDLIFKLHEVAALGAYAYQTFFFTFYSWILPILKIILWKHATIITPNQNSHMNIINMAMVISLFMLKFADCLAFLYREIYLLFENFCSGQNFELKTL